MILINMEPPHPILDGLLIIYLIFLKFKEIYGSSDSWLDFSDFSSSNWRCAS